MDRLSSFAVDISIWRQSHYADSWHQTFAAEGWAVTKTEVYQQEGAPWRESILGFANKNGQASLTEADYKRMLSVQQELFSCSFELKIFRGTENLLSFCRRSGWALALVTGTPHDKVCQYLPAKLYQKFDQVIGGDDTPRGKPHPDPYLTAASALGIAPANCLVVENAPLGIRSAQAAGTGGCIAVLSSLARAYLPQADLFVANLPELQRYLERALANE